jgi:large subunit ribosomal protein L4
LQGTASTLTRAEVRGGGRKPYAQKGTGNARIGSRRTPLKPGGGVVFGPKPKDWTIKMNKKERRLATATALASAASDAVVVDGLTLPDAKTKTLVSRLAALGADPMTQHVLVIADLVSENLLRAAKNVERLTVNRAGALNAREILKADRVVIEEGALAAINEFYGAAAAEVAA